MHDEFAQATYEELRKLAHYYMRGERPNHTLQATALVNEAYVRLAGVDRMEWRERTHFFAMAATMMRRILVDHARAHGRDKRGGGISVTTITTGIPAPAAEVDL